MSTFTIQRRKRSEKDWEIVEPGLSSRTMQHKWLYIKECAEYVYRVIDEHKTVVLSKMNDV